MEYYDEVVEIKQKSDNIDKNNEPGILKISDDGDEDLSLSSRKLEKILPSTQRPSSSVARKRAPMKPESIGGSDSDSSDSDPNENKAFVTDHKEWANLDVSTDIKEIFQYILRYSPPKIEIDYNLQPFIPDYIPAVGDIDAFLKVVPPKPINDNNKRNVIEFIDKLGLEILDEPSGQQSEPALLHMKLRSISTQPRKAGPPPSVSKSFKDIEKWIAEVQLLNVNQPFPMVLHNRPLQEIDSLMTEWPPEMERTLNNLGFPSASLNCSLTFYIELICSIFDITIPEKRTQADYILALHTLFNLYLAVKNSVE